MIMGVFAFDGSQRASTMTAEKAVVTIMTLKRPVLSAMIPGKIRPKIEAAFKIDRRYEDKLADMLSF